MKIYTLLILDSIPLIYKIRDVYSLFKNSMGGGSRREKF
jgi:hypothetical protein